MKLRANGLWVLLKEQEDSEKGTCEDLNEKVDFLYSNDAQISQT